MAQVINTQHLEELAPSLSPSEVYWIYNGLDVTVTYDVLENVRKQLDPIAQETYHHSMELTAPFMEMSLRGFPLDLARREEISTHYRDTYAKLEKMFTRVCVEGLGLPAAPNPGSPKQMKEFFHDTLGLPEKKKRKKGADEATVTLDRETLESLAATYMSATLFVAIILAMRDAKKALGFINSRFDADNRLRCNFNIAGTNTGRLSSSISDLGTGTNMQNVSGKLKDLFIAEPGDVIFDIDLEQGDSRGVAALAWNWFLESHGAAFAGSYLDACESGDLHTTVCRMAWPQLSWTDDPKRNKEIAGALAYRDNSYRDLAKKLGHGTNYLGQPRTMASHTKVPVKQIEIFQAGYFSGFPCVKEWQNETIRRLTEQRYLFNLFDRRRYFWGDPSSSSVRNAAIAYAPQSTTGEFINRGILQLYRLRNALDLPIKLVLQVHDSLVVFAKADRRHEMKEILTKTLPVTKMLEGGREFTIPLGFKMGFNYGAFDPEKNPHGMMKYSPSDDRPAPRRVHKPLSYLLDKKLSAV